MISNSHDYSNIIKAINATGIKEASIPFFNPYHPFQPKYITSIPLQPTSREVHFTIVQCKRQVKKKRATKQNKKVK